MQYTIHTHEPKKTLFKALDSAVSKMSQQAPLIIFGLSEYSFNQLHYPGYKIYFNKDTDVDGEKGMLLNRDKCIVGLDDSYTIGLDLRFKKDAYVMVYATEIPKLETLKQ